MHQTGAILTVHMIAVMTVYTCRAQDLSAGAVALAAGAYATVTTVSGWSNPAFSGISDRPVIALWSGIFFGLPELRLSGLSAGLKISQKHDVGVKAVVTSLGYDAFQQFRIDGGLSFVPLRGMGRPVRLGLGVSVLRLSRAPSGFRTESIYRLGIFAPLSSIALFSVALDIPSLRGRRPTTDQSMAATIGIELSPDGPMRVRYDLSKAAFFPISHRFGMALKVAPPISLLLGWRSDPSLWSAGFTLDVHALSLALAIENHSALGRSHAVEVRWTL